MKMLRESKMKKEERMRRYIPDMNYKRKMKKGGSGSAMKIHCDGRETKSPLYSLKPQTCYNM